MDYNQDPANTGLPPLNDPFTEPGPSNPLHAQYQQPFFNDFVRPQDQHPFSNHSPNLQRQSARLPPLQNGTASFTEAPQPPPPTNPVFDIARWHVAYNTCTRFFLDHGQHEDGTRALFALLNILLPCQWPRDTVHSSADTAAASINPLADERESLESVDPIPQGHRRGFYFPMNNDVSNGSSMNGSNEPSRGRRVVSLIPYIRRLVVTAHTAQTILHGLFGSQYPAGILPLLEIERRNYLFTVRSAGWAETKRKYDEPGGQHCTFLSPLEGLDGAEMEAAEAAWERWMQMERWAGQERRQTDMSFMDGEIGGVRIKREEDI